MTYSHYDKKVCTNCLESNMMKDELIKEYDEKSNDNDRISPDDIGNDTHEFLHGGDK